MEFTLTLDSFYSYLFSLMIIEGSKSYEQNCVVTYSQRETVDVKSPIHDLLALLQTYNVNLYS